jgi:hypothetical protein
MLEAGNVIKCVAEWCELLERADIFVADVNMGMGSLHKANITNYV